MGNTCDFCGSRLSNEAKFCSNCGAHPEIPLYEPDEDVQSMFLRYDNRLNRQRFILRSFGLFLVVVVIEGVLLTVAEILQSTLIYMLAIIVSLMFMIPSFMLVIRRLHDLDRPGWWCIGTMIPGINIIFAVYLVLFVGTNGPNRYGPDPLYEV